MAVLLTGSEDVKFQLLSSTMCGFYLTTSDMLLLGLFDCCIFL